ncbi:MAG TPA: CBS domain-containing protein [Candidatus Dormibacteraeota bacterium]|nr:CBS domain-containing protein [Candidatus Dormibacteraeota bacterium]
MIFLSDFLRADVVDIDQRTVGSVRDVIVRMDEPYPVVTAVAIRGRTKELPAAIDWGAVRAGEGGELSLNVPTSGLQLYPLAGEEIWLARDILDKQIVDTDGRRVVRVNDLQLQEQDGKLLMVGVDIGARGLLRRLGVERLGRRVTHLVGRDFPQRLISWDAVDPVRSDERSMRLRISHKKLSKMHPADIAEIVGQLGGRDRAAIFASLDDEIAADVVEESSDEVQAQILARLDDERAADILEAMEPDEAADLLGDLPEERREQLIAKMEADGAEDVEELLGYEDDTAGGLMTTEFVAVPVTLTAQQTIDRLRELEPDAESIYYIYVVDEDERLLGVLSLRDLIVAPPQAPIADIMIKRVVAVPLDARPEDVAAVIAKYNLLAVPVVDDEDRMQGIVTIDDAMDEVMPAGVRRRARAL